MQVNNSNVQVDRGFDGGGWSGGRLCRLIAFVLIMGGAAALVVPDAIAEQPSQKRGTAATASGTTATHSTAANTNTSPATNTSPVTNTIATAMTTRVDAKAILAPRSDDGFHFVIYGDRTGGVPAGLEILKQAVADTNLLDPDLVMTVGDLIQGYNATDDWLPEMEQYKSIMQKLKMNWYPVAGNHDIYWRGRGLPPGHHESNYEQHFGPLWYCFEHKNCGFVVLYSDEGDPKTNRKGFHDFELQQFSQQQLAFLDKALQQLKSKDHVLVFLHHPRWIESRYQGSNWPVVHEKLVAAGNVKACFAGHIHFQHYNGLEDGIEYFTLGATGGHIQDDLPDAGFLHQMNVVSVRSKNISVASIPVGAVYDPKKFTPAFHDAIALARAVAPIQFSPPLQISADRSVQGDVVMRIQNPCPGTINGTLVFDSQSASGWGTTLDHSHFSIAGGKDLELTFKVRRFSGADEMTALPQLVFTPVYLDDSQHAAVRLAPVTMPIKMTLADLPDDFFDDASPHALLVESNQGAVKVNSETVPLPDGPLTLEAWVKPATTSGHNAIIAKTQSSEYALFFDEGVPQFDIHLGGRYRTAKAIEKLPTDAWTHLAGVYDGATVSIFVDGKKVASVDGSGKRRTNNLPLFIGADPDAAGQPTRCFQGLIDEVRLSPTAVYGDDFKPSSTLTSSAKTALLMPLDKRVGPFVLDHSEHRHCLLMGAEGKLVPVQRSTR